MSTEPVKHVYILAIGFKDVSHKKVGQDTRLFSERGEYMFSIPDFHCPAERPYLKLIVVLVIDEKLLRLSKKILVRVIYHDSGIRYRTKKVYEPPHILGWRKSPAFLAQISRNYKRVQPPSPVRARS